MIRNIPQLDGTFDMEDLMSDEIGNFGSILKLPRIENSLATSAVTRTEACTDPELGNLPSDTVTCKCPRINEIKSCKKDPRRFRIPQLDGSSDNDFWESDDFSRKSRKGSKTPLKTYGKLALKKKQTLRRRRKDSFTEREDLRKFRIDLLMGGHSSKGSDFSCVAESSSSICSSTSGENSPGGKAEFKKSEEGLKASQRRKCDAFSFPSETNKSKTAVRRTRTNIQAKPRNTEVKSSGSPGQKSSRGIVLSPECFYSSSKLVSSQISSSPRRARAKRKSLGRLEFTETSNNTKRGSRKEKVRDIEETSTLVNIPYDDKEDDTSFYMKSREANVGSQGASTSKKPIPAQSPCRLTHDDKDDDEQFSMKSRRTNHGSRSTRTNRKHNAEDLAMKATEISMHVTEPLSTTRSTQSGKISLSTRPKSELKQKKSATEQFRTTREKHKRKATLSTLTQSELEHSESSGAERFDSVGLIDVGSPLENVQKEKSTFDTGSEKDREEAVKGEHGSFSLRPDAEFQRQIRKRSGRRAAKGISLFDTESEEGLEETVKGGQGNILLSSDTEFQIQVTERSRRKARRGRSIFDTESEGCLEEPLKNEQGNVLYDSDKEFHAREEKKSEQKSLVGSVTRGLTYPFTRDCYVHLTDLKLHGLQLSQDTGTVTTEQAIASAELMTSDAMKAGMTDFRGKGPKKRRHLLSLSKSTKKARFEDSDPDVKSTRCDFSKRFESDERLEKDVENSESEMKSTRSALFMRRESGVQLGRETFGDENTCDSCCDFLFKSSHPSPESIVMEEAYSPPRPFTPNKTKSRMQLRERHDKRCVGGVEIQFQNDSNCTLIKPVRLEFGEGLARTRNENMADQSQECQGLRLDLQDRALNSQVNNRAVESRKEKTDCDTDAKMTGEGRNYVNKSKSKPRVASLKTLVKDLQYSPIIDEVKWKNHRSKSSQVSSRETRSFVSSQISQENSLSDRFDAPSIGESTQTQTGTQRIGLSDGKTRTEGVECLLAENSGSVKSNVVYKSNESSTHSDIGTTLRLADIGDSKASPNNDMVRHLSLYHSHEEDSMRCSQSELPGKKTDRFKSNVDQLKTGVEDNQHMESQTSASKTELSEIVSSSASKFHDGNTTCIVTFDTDTPVMEITPEEMQDLDILVEDSLDVDSLQVAMNEDENEMQVGSAKPKNLVLSEETVSRKASEPAHFDFFVDQQIVLFEDPEKPVETIKSSIEDKSEEMPTESHKTDLRAPGEMAFSTDKDERRRLNTLVVDLEKTTVSCSDREDWSSNTKAESIEICAEGVDEENSTGRSIDLKLSDSSSENQEHVRKPGLKGRCNKMDSGRKHKSTAMERDEQSLQEMNMAQMEKIHFDKSAVVDSDHHEHDPGGDKKIKGNNSEKQSVLPSEVSTQLNDENISSDRSEIRGASPIPCALESNFSDSTVAVEVTDIANQERRVSKGIASRKDESVLVKPAQKPPSRKKIKETASDYGLGETRHKKAYFSDAKDVPAQIR